MSPLTIEICDIHLYYDETHYCMSCVILCYIYIYIFHYGSVNDSKSVSVCQFDS